MLNYTRTELKINSNKSYGVMKPSLNCLIQIVTGIYGGDEEFTCMTMIPNTQRLQKKHSWI